MRCLQQGRDWRSLADTGTASHVLRDYSRSWARLRRSQDYYMEGMLFWLEVDAIIRKQTEHRRSLDDFCREFFAAELRRLLATRIHARRIVVCLNRVAPYDWSGLVARRIETVSERFEPSVVDRLGYAIQYSNVAPAIPQRHVSLRVGRGCVRLVGLRDGHGWHGPGMCYWVHPPIVPAWDPA